MPKGEPTKAPIIIFGCILGVSIVCVGIVAITHSQRTEPYLDTKVRRIKRVQRPVATPAAPSFEHDSARPPEHADDDAGVDARSGD